MAGWAACLLSGGATHFAALRLFPDVEFAEIGGACWLRGSKLDEELERELKKIPGLTRFEQASSGRLRPVGSRIPDRALPPAAWQPLRQAVKVGLPVAALGGQTNQRVPIRLIRTSEEQPAFALRTSLETWVDYAIQAALVRLHPLRFAAMETREVLLLGSPLPGIPGQLYSETAGLLLPCGFAWAPAVSSSVLRQVFNARAEDFVVLAEDDTHQVIPEEQFVPASRSAVRLTLAEWSHA